MTMHEFNEQLKLQARYAEWTRAVERAHRAVEQANEWAIDHFKEDDVRASFAECVDNAFAWDFQLGALDFKVTVFIDGENYSTLMLDPQQSTAQFADNIRIGMERIHTEVGCSASVG